MFDTGDRRIGERGGSLLSLGRAIEDERAKQRPDAMPKRAAHPDAVQRHQLARRQREGAPSPATSGDGPQSSSARPSAGAAGGLDSNPGLLDRLRGSWRQPAREPSPVSVEDAARGKPVKDQRHDPRPPLSAPVREPRSKADVVTTEPESMSDTLVVVERGDQDAWRPLIDPSRVIGGVLDSKGLIVATTLIGALLGAGLAITTPKKYEAYAEVLVHPRDLKLFDRDLTDVAGLPSDATLAIIENQVRVLTSSTVLNRVVDKLGLENDPEFNGSGGLDMNPLNFIRSLLTRSDGAADPTRLRGLTVQKLAENINVERTGKTFTILVGAMAQSPKRAAEIANTMVGEFLDTANKRQADTAGKATVELTGKLDEMRRNVDAAERKIEQFKAENDIIDAQGRLITDDEIVKLNDQLSIAKARTLELSARAQSAKNLNTDDVLSGASPEAAASGVLTELRTQYATAKQEAERLSVRLGPRHPEYQAAQAQLDGAREQIGVELRRINAQVQTELRRAVQLEQELAGRLAQLKVRQGNLSTEMVTLRELEREASTQRSVYEAFLLRARETGEQQGISTVNISVISDAQPPLEASGASRAVITGVGGFLGLLFGIGLGGLRGAFASLRESSPSRRRRTATVRKAAAPEARPTASSPTNATVSSPPASAMQEPTAPTEPPTQPSKGQASATGEAPTEESPMNARYVPPGYYPEQAPFDGYAGAPHTVQAPQASYPQPVYPYPSSGFPAPPPAYAQGSFVPPQPGYAPPAYPQNQPMPQYQAWPHPPQAHYPQPPAPLAAPLQQAAVYGGHPGPLYPPAYPQAAQHPAASYYAQPMAPPRPAAPATDNQALGGSLSEIRESIREFRDAVRELTDSRSHRRYF
ncbi:MAG: Wzz/FepE/Etk N-terminal domain-containing protein [Rhizobiaceae bacterium]